MDFIIAFPGFVIVALMVPALAVRWFLVPGDRKRTEWFLVATTLVEPMGMAAQLTANALSPLRPFKYDLYIYQFDTFFGSPSFRLGQMTWKHLWLHNLISVSYGLLPAAMLSVFAAYLYLRSSSEALRIVKVFTLFFFSGALVYLIIPVSGPVYAFPHFPEFPAPFIAHPLSLAAPPNAVPSGHTGGALLVLYFLWQWMAGRVFGIIFLALTVLATLGSGQHYLFDLITAVPYTAVVILIFKHRSVNYA